MRANGADFALGCFFVVNHEEDKGSGLESGNSPD
jgi:hypothetical protein